MTNEDKLDKLLIHIENVRQNTEILGRKLIKLGQFDLGKKLIINGLRHDISKLECTVEWECLWDEGDKPRLDLAIHNHNTTNLHHPEAWENGIKGMPDLFLAEFVCDTKARSSEFGTDFRIWIDGKAAEKYGYTKEDEVYQKLQYFIDLLIDKPFS